MPQERDSQYPHVTAEEWEKIKAEVPREIAAARLIASRKVTGIPHRPYVTGQSDHAPVLQGVAEFAALVYTLLDATNDIENIPASVEDAASAVYSAMEDF